MKILKKVILIFTIFFVLAAVVGYIYFDRKFTPDKNYLVIENESGKVPLTWLGTEKNVLLLPIHFERDTTTYYLQFDTGSPYTIFYSKSINKISQILVNQEKAKSTFYIGKTRITSDMIKIYNQGNDKDDSLKIIGTAGTDILENKKTLINFKENYIVLNLAKVPAQFQTRLFDFEFKKRKILFSGLLNGKQDKFLFDSGTSAYELLTNKEVWLDLKLEKSKINIEQSQSWDKVLTAYTAKCNQKIQFYQQEIRLKNITYVEGFSQAQYLMMKYSGMTGMLGNKIFLNHSLFFDSSQNKMGIE